jgi:hypothetical protein
MSFDRSAIKTIIARGRHLAYRAAPWVLSIYFWSLTSPLVLAAKKKKEEVAPTKSYVVPYMIVIALVSIGLMTVFRPSRRQDKPPDQKVKEAEE